MKAAIIGPGLIGMSVALALQRADGSAEIVEIDRGDSLRAAADADLAVLAAPVDVILDILRNHADIFRGVVTIDTGSTKKEIVAAARNAGLDRFVGGHPMAGAATSGPAGARADLFEDRPWFLVTGGAAPEAVTRATAFVASLGARPILLDDDGGEHDRVMAAVSHLPQLVATTLMNVAAEAAGERLSWAGSGLRDATRLAASSATMWESVLATNAAALKPLLLDMSRRLADLADTLAGQEKIRQLFEKGNAYRKLL